MIKCESCPEMIPIKTNLRFCDKCRAVQRKKTQIMNNERQKTKRQEHKTAKLPKTGVERVFKQSTSEEDAPWLKHLVRSFCDVGESSPVTIYTPNHPDFSRLAAMYN